MKVLTFDTDIAKEFYKIIYEGLCMTQKQFTPKEVRRLDKIFTAFESIGVVTEETKEARIQFYELPEIAVIELEDADYEIVKSAIEPPNVAWSGFGARKAGRALEWLDGVKNKETKPELVKKEKE